jgi:hypothetical protein
MKKNQRVADMVDEVLARQARARAERTGEAFEEALKAVLETEAGRQLRELRDGPHHDERAGQWQEDISRERTEERHRESKAEGVSEIGGSAPVPEAWIGRTVELIFISGGSTEYTDGDLEGVNDRGIVLSVETQVGHPARSLFYPWSAVIQLSEALNG